MLRAAGPHRRSGVASASGSHRGFGFPEFSPCWLSQRVQFFSNFVPTLLEGFGFLITLPFAVSLRGYGFPDFESYSLRVPTGLNVSRQYSKVSNRSTSQLQSYTPRSTFGESWFQQPQGKDYPLTLYKDCSKWRTCRIASTAGWFEAKVQVILDSQQPRFVIRTTTQEHGWRLVIPLQYCFLQPGIEGATGDGTRAEIQQLRQRFPECFEDWPQVYYFSIWCYTNPVIVKTAGSWFRDDPDWNKIETFPWVTVEKEGIFIFQRFEPKFKTVPDTIQWLTVLSDLCVKDCGDAPGKAFWWYRRNPPKDGEGRSPPMPWLFTKEQDPSKRQYTQLDPHDPFFIDDHNRRCRLIEASRIEKDTQYQLVAKIFNPSRRHRAWYAPAQTDTLRHSFFVHIKLQAEDGETEVNVPQLAEMTEVQYEVAEKGRTYLKTDLNQKGLVVETDSTGDLVLLVKGSIPQHRGEFEIVTFVKPNTMPIDEQIKALWDVSHFRSWGELDGKEKKGYSLERTVLAHGVELDPASDFYFLLDARKMSEVPPEQQDERISYIMKNFPLDEAQHQAFLKSTFEITCGVNLIQGPPGTGKTRTAMVIILLLMALDLKVLLVAGSNKGVDNLAEAVVATLNKHPQLQQWCGQFIRFRTPAYQLAQVRIDSANPDRVRLGASRKGSSASQILEPVQIYNVVQRFAKENAETRHCGDFLDMVRRDKECHLSRDQSKKLRNSYENCASSVLANCKVVATTLSNASQELLRNSGFNPDFVISDEAGQCLEGDHCIALTMSSVKAVVLIGDPDQLPPTVISENDCNEGAKYLKRSLMTRLHQAGYPCTMLTTNYRNHSAILDLWNQHVYGGALQVGRSNDAPDRVGNAWDAFTSSQHYFRRFGVAGLRRLFISTDGHADRHQNSLSLYNRPQVEVLRHLLPQLYQFETPQGDKIEAKDVMIISPYRDQRALVDKVLGKYNIGFNENVTVDGAQGSESPVVVFLMTKPSRDVRSVGFVGDRNRLNVALSRAQKVLIIIGNLDTWNSEAIEDIRKSTGRRNKFLLDLLRDVTWKRHTLTWHGADTVEELDPPRDTEMIYKAHDRDIPRPSMRVATPAVAATAGVQSQTATLSVPRPRVSLPQCASYRQALQPLPPRPPLPGLSAAPRQDEVEAADEDVEMEDFQDQGTPYPGSDPRENVKFALQPYREREQSRYPEHSNLSPERGYRDRHSPRRDLAMTAAPYNEAEDVQALERQRDELRIRGLRARAERFRAEEERAALEARLIEERLRQAARERRRHER
ncbi:DEAD/DEAH box helicase [Aspergillus thermomutatus]|uniref:DNA2/NAM7 helicase-like C-terminal domain-containing protein n=1 Tax=Aspergillus thermomutatus TaxID=41047 RepID=A0A397I4G0_ASPTH|nr:uncharacterized protein CDV56_103150 [Aspergillus thermomutatus]RHZ68274.1 hypothetical protein CDV56_103150 [Aspergillus thermomutatus]